MILQNKSTHLSMTIIAKSWKTRCIVYGDERERIATSVSTCGLQRQSKEDKLSSNEVSTSSRLHIEHTNSYDETIQTRTFQFQ